jgi:RES domain-containing protein
VTLPPQWEKDALGLVEQASPLERRFFRSVELAYGHPDDVISGEGTRLYGGRFVKPGLRAVYGSADEETALKESAARMNRLAGRGGARITAYPRITYVISVRDARRPNRPAGAACALDTVPRSGRRDRFARVRRVPAKPGRSSHHLPVCDSRRHWPKHRGLPRHHSGVGRCSR